MPKQKAIKTSRGFSGTFSTDTIDTAKDVVSALRHPKKLMKDTFAGEKAEPFKPWDAATQKRNATERSAASKKYGWQGAK